MNMWTLARPLIETWMIENRGPEARLARMSVDLWEGASRLPALVRAADQALGDLEKGGLRLHPDTVERLAARKSGRTGGLLVALIVGLLVGWWIG